MSKNTVSASELLAALQPDVYSPAIRSRGWAIKVARRFGSSIDDNSGSVR
jgi:hypothetical protein